MDLQSAFEEGLPKWPQLYITGPDVSVEQAKAIIFKTEVFLNSLGSRGGNNRAWNAWVVRLLGLEKVSDEMSGGVLSWHGATTRDRALLQLGYAIRNKWSAEQALTTEYVEIDRASCCFIGGPHGWCDPDGKIYFDDNVGKYPSVRDIYEELQLIATTFPFVKMTATLFDGESCEETRKPVVTFQMADGIVGVADYERGDTNVMRLHSIQEDTSKEGADAKIQRAVANLMRGDREQGLPTAWVVEFAEKFRQWLPGAAEAILQEMSVDDANEVRPTMKAIAAATPSTRGEDLRREVGEVIQETSGYP